MSQPCSTSTRCTSWPSGPVWWVTSVMPSIRCAGRARLVRATSTTLTPPPLPRPPAWICALTTRPRRRARARPPRPPRACARPARAAPATPILPQQRLGLVLVDLHPTSILDIENLSHGKKRPAPRSEPGEGNVGGRRTCLGRAGRPPASGRPHARGGAASPHPALRATFSVGRRFVRIPAPGMRPVKCRVPRAPPHS